MSKIIEELDAEQMGKTVPDFAPGDSVVVQVRIREASASGSRRSRAS